MAFYTQRTAVPLAAGQQLGFTTGRGYYARNTPTGAAAATADPFAAMSPQDINATISRFTSGYGQPLTDPQIQSRAQSQIDPIIAAITSQVNGRVKGATDAIKGYTDSLAGQLGQIDYTAPYRSAITGQAAVDSALQQSLSGQGSQLAQDLSTRLAQIGDPSVQQAADAVAQRGQALGTTELARGSTNLGALLANSAAAGAYGEKQPGIARTAGLQQIGGVQSQGVSDIADKTASILGQLPSIVSSLRSSNDSLRDNRASLAAQLYQALTGQNITRATAKAGLVSDQTKLGLQYAPTPDASLSNSVHHLVDQYGNPVLDANGKTIPAGTPPKSPKTGTSLSAKDAVKLADDLRYGIQPKQQWDSKNSTFVDVPNTGTPNSSYGEAYGQLVAAGLSAAQARALVNSRYKPGEFGRPLTKAQQKTAAAVKSGLGLPKSPLDALLGR